MKAAYRHFVTIRDVIEFINEKNIRKEDIISFIRNGDCYYLIYFRNDKKEDEV